MSQLGTRLSASPDTLQDYEKALFAVFGLQVLMNDRKAAKIGITRRRVAQLR
ncbi:hypothetical protein [Klebsiella pneumoniae]|uniref:hypothetical protein n=1 Tax=Klebsiella pneumoniae TaxID=573 RepID=UPI004044A2D7